AQHGHHADAHGRGAGERGLQRRQPRARARDRADDPRGAGAARPRPEHLRERADLGGDVRAQSRSARPEDPARSHRLRGLRDLGSRRQAVGRCACELLGGYRSELPIISIGGYYMEGKTHADIGREMEAYRLAGMAGCKFKVGGLTPDEDARRVEAARRAAGPDFRLAVDANRGCTAPDAIRFAHLVEPLDIRWFEEPCHWSDDA